MTKKIFIARLKRNHLSLDDFAKLTNIPAGTVYGWNRENKTVPNWVESWLDNYEKAKLYDLLKEKFFEIENNKIKIK
ncbi:helix-turn-helix domain-containing protein [Campylobacter canadensis]|uniref:hypothetical protein n=1 Tax=Campylobacter canadensis TaxID=449520 RepID=UPI001CCA0E68|nr:hypothetical protein [Campylobacter canadensis]MBZ8002660.1 hypothetical protein [Campylobacter canadensis]